MCIHTPSIFTEKCENSLFDFSESVDYNVGNVCSVYVLLRAQAIPWIAMMLRINFLLVFGPSNNGLSDFPVHSLGLSLESHWYRISPLSGLQELQRGEVMVKQATGMPFIF